MSLPLASQKDKRMLTPSPKFPRRVMLVRRGLGQASVMVPSIIGLPSTSSPSASAGAGFPYWSGRPRHFVRGGGFGLGQDGTDTQMPCGIPPLAACPGDSSGTSTPPGTTGGGINWTNVIQAAITGTSKVVAQQTNPFAPKNLPAGTSYQMTPYGTTVMTAGSTPIGTAALTSNLSSFMPLLLIGGGLMLMMSMVRR